MNRLNLIAIVFAAAITTIGVAVLPARAGGVRQDQSVIVTGKSGVIVREGSQTVVVDRKGSGKNKQTVTITQSGNATGNIVVTGSGKNRSFTTNGQSASISGSGNNITLRGTCQNLTVSGSGNNVTVDRVGVITVNGSANRVTYRQGPHGAGSRPAVTKNDTGNMVSHVR